MNEENKQDIGGITQQAVDSTAEPTIEEGTVARAINAALAPISQLIWGYDQIAHSLESKLAEVLVNVPEERIATPAANVAGPAIEAFKFSGNDETLQDFFVNLIAKSLDSKTILFAHPSFVNIIKNLLSDEGLILKLFTTAQQFPMIDVNLKLIKTGGLNTLHRNVSMIGLLAKCTNMGFATQYIDNLCHLGLIEITTDRNINDSTVFDELINDPSIAQIKKQFEGNENFSVVFDKKFIELTSLGSDFIKTCVLDKKPKKNIA